MGVGAAATSTIGSRPRYVQLAATLLSEIRSGRYPVGSLLPTEFELCDEFGVSRFTARAAVKLLVQQGLVVRSRGIGSRVRETAPQAQYTQTMSDITDLRQYAHETSFEVETCTLVRLGEAEAERLRAGLGETWLQVQGLRYLAGEGPPLCHTEAWIAPRFRSVTGIEGRMMQPLYQLIEEQFGCTIVTVEQEIRATILDPAQARRLGVARRSAGLWLARRYLDEHGELAELAVSLHPAERFTYRESFRRDWQPGS
jgi:DNA-binding GntR family transcriptional regulator